jgi:hypothetical protein
MNQTNTDESCKRGPDFRESLAMEFTSIKDNLPISQEAKAAATRDLPELITRHHTGTLP